MCGKYRLTNIANFLINVLRAEIVTTFGSKMVGISNLLFRTGVCQCEIFVCFVGKHANVAG